MSKSNELHPEKSCTHDIVVGLFPHEYAWTEDLFTDVFVFASCKKAFEFIERQRPGTFVDVAVMEESETIIAYTGIVPQRTP